jgi:hypothetical protein
MASNWVENTLVQDESVTVSFFISGTSATLWLQNVGRNIVEIRRILLGLTRPSGGGTNILFLRPPGNPGAWAFPSDRLEPGGGGQFLTLTGLAPGTILQAQAEYTEVLARSRSCQFTL